MTAEAIDRIDMATMNEQILDEMFAQMTIPEGYKAEIVEGNVYMSPQRDTHWDIILGIIEQLRVKYPRRSIKSDVRIDYPGHLNGFATDLTLVSETAVKNAKGLWLWQDVMFVVEVISRGTGTNDYGPKKAAYAAAEIPAYLIVDPYQGRCHLYARPKDGDYLTETTVAFGMDVDLTCTPVGLTIDTVDFDRD
ncbi:Uma2 family endonuclease [Streptomyces sp. NPDC016845]|uniref:Uma2 family endonuclease n=1 Tax=Streptomyces sp. NPDC016845 TaxID=3364972 RepID=UPI0037B7C519